LSKSPLKIFFIALLFTWLFFFEYLPPIRWVHLPYDLEGYHYSLADYAFQSVKQLRWPQWDPTTYSGMSFAANVQSTLYYPGTWVMFALKWGNERLSYLAMQEFEIVHVALAFTLCYVWLIRKRLVPLAAVLGALVYAYGGYLCTQLQHVGLVLGHAWMPLALIGIDESAERKSWLPLWKTTVGMALIFLGGYPPVWVVLSIVALTYALASPGRIRTVPGVAVALIFALVMCGIQALPTWDATHFRDPESRYGNGIKDPLFFASLLIPNYFDFGMNMPGDTNSGKDYLYLGAPGIFGFLLSFTQRKFAAIIPALAVTIVMLVLVINPFNIILPILSHSTLLLDIFRSYYFMAGVAVGLAELSAHGINAFLTRDARPLPRWMMPAAVVLMVIWSSYQLKRWFAPYQAASFAHGFASATDAAVALAIFTLAIYVYRGQRDKRLSWLLIALLAFVFIDYKVFGTSKRVDAAEGNGPVFSSKEFGAMNIEAYQALKAAPDYRILIHELGPLPADARHVGWNVAQGFEPFMSSKYRDLIKATGQFTTDRLFLIDPLRLDAMEIYGFRFVITGERAPKYKPLMDHPRFRMVGKNDSYYKVFQYLDAKPLYQFAGSVDVQRRDPEHRILRANSDAGGLLTFSEQSYPGWSAKLDGQPLAIEPWQIAFQAVRVPAGEHTIEFIYRERLLPLGAAISVGSLALLAWWIVADKRASSRSTYSKANLAVSV
jgi:hypothetical protein